MRRERIRGNMPRFQILESSEEPMRRIAMSLSVAAVLLTFAIISVAAKLPRKTAGAASKTRATPTYGNVDSISEEELKIYDYFQASDQLEGRNFPSREAQARRAVLFSRISCPLR